MRRPQDGPAGRQAGAQGAQEAADTSRPGTATGASATGASATGTASATGSTAGAAENTASSAENTAGAARTTPRGRSGAPDEQAPAPASHQGGAVPTAEYRGEPLRTGGVLTLVAGLLTFFAGLAAVERRHFYPTLSGYAYQLNVQSWGWILLVLGVLLFAAGASALLGLGWARAFCVGLAVLTAVAGFLFLAYTPVWGVIIVALSIIAIWGLLHDDGEARRTGLGPAQAAGPGCPQQRHPPAR